MPKVSATHKDHLPRVIVVCGATATGKTKLAISLAHRFDGEIINADSRQMYQGLSIISGKDIAPGSSATVRRTVLLKGQKIVLLTYDIDSVPVWLYDVASVEDPLSVSHFQELAAGVMKDIVSRGKVPIVVGGTGFYLESLFHTIDSLQIPQNPEFRKMLSGEGAQLLSQKLRIVDPKRWKGMNMSDRNNPRRLLRALEVAAWKKTHTNKQKYQTQFEPIWIGLTVDEDEIARRIRDRVEARLSSGALEEAKTMQHLPDILPAASTIGLSILLRHARGEIDRDQVAELWEREEMRYAKRQMVWFKRQSGFRWYDAGDEAVSNQVVKDLHQWYT